MNMEVLALLQAFLAGWVSCHFYIAWKMRQSLKKVAEENGMTLDELADTFLQSQGVRSQVIKVPNYFTEINGSSILLYNKDTGEFIGQANTVEELAENLFKYDKVPFALVNHSDKKFWFVEGKVENNLKEI